MRRDGTLSIVSVAPSWGFIYRCRMEACWKSLWSFVLTFTPYKMFNPEDNCDSWSVRRWTIGLIFWLWRKNCFESWRCVGEMYRMLHHLGLLLCAFTMLKLWIFSPVWHHWCFSLIFLKLRASWWWTLGEFFLYWRIQITEHSERSDQSSAVSFRPGVSAH